MLRWPLVFSAVAALWLPAAAAADEVDTPISIEAGLGFTADPDSFLLGIALPWELSHEVSVGPLVQLGFDDDYTLVLPSINARYSFDLSTNDHAELRRLRPHVDLGVGFAYAKLDDVPSFVDDDDIEFMMNFGVGAEYRISRAWSLGSRMRINVMPGDLFGEDLIYSWEVAGFRFRF